MQLVIPLGTLGQEDGGGGEGHSEVIVIVLGPVAGGGVGLEGGEGHCPVMLEASQLGRGHDDSL